MYNADILFKRKEKSMDLKCILEKFHSKNKEAENDIGVERIETCGGCKRNCPLSAPRCKKGIRKANGRV